MTTLTFFRFNSPSSRIWAFWMMRKAHLISAPGLKFYKMMGSGKGLSFDLIPDWSTYALLGVWTDEESARAFISRSDFMRQYRDHCVEVWTIFMNPLHAKGTWSGQMPFQFRDRLSSNDLIAVITRATIKWSRLRSFWSYVPTSEKPLKNSSGLIFSKGIGETPIVQMATFSIWKTEDLLRDFAYRSREHQGAIKRTRDLNWYKEEMFSRFQPIDSTGTWGGVEILSPYL